MSAPLYRDPIHDGATDPTVVAGPDGRWWMFYTQRRAGLEGEGVEWVHGSRIGIATSVDGKRWEYQGVIDGLDPAGEGGLNTHWAPEVIEHDGVFHMLLTWIAGTPTTWAGHERHILHLESADLRAWRHRGRIDLGTDRVIDAAVARTGDGRWRLWAKDEAADSTTLAAVSDDLAGWDVEGVVIAGDPHEGPNVFQLGGWFWMLTDEWRGLRVHRSTDGLAWERRGLVLDRPGAHPLDRQVGRHADVVVVGDEAHVVYFTHPHWDGSEVADAARPEHRLSAVHIAAARVVDGELRVDRDVPAALPHPSTARLVRRPRAQRV